MNLIKNFLNKYSFLVFLSLIFLVGQLKLNAQEFPVKGKPIEVVIHTTYGGGTDVTARIMSIQARAELDTDILIVAKRGGSGSAAHDYLMSRPADGHTILALTQTHLYTIAQGKSKMKIDDIVGVVRAMDDPTFFVVSGQSKYKTFKEMVDASKTKPINLGIANIGGTEHIGAIRLAKASGLNFKPVAFESGGKMVQALMSGSIDATVPNVSESLTQLQEGTFKALLVMSKKRIASYPKVPTAIELGYKDVLCSTTRGYAVLASTPKPIVEKLSKALLKSMNDDVFVKYLKGSGLTPADSIADSETWDRELKKDFKEASAILKEIGLLN